MRVVCYLLFIGALVGICRSFLFERSGNGRCTFGDWSKCTMNDYGELIRTRSPTSGRGSYCRRETARCSVGTFLADAFIENLLQPVVIRQGSRRRSGGRSGFNFNRHFSQASTPSPPAQQRCTEIRDRRGNLIMGNCNTGAQRSDQSRRRRSIPNVVTFEQPKRDLLIMLDESGSIGPTKFEKLKRIGATIVELLCQDILVHQDKTRVSVMSFDSSNHNHIALNKYFQDQDELTTFIKEISYNSTTDGQTCMNSALQHAMNTALSNSNGGRRGQNKVQQDIILVTDGCANCETGVTTSLNSTANQLIAKGINVYVIGVGLDNNCEQNLKILAQGGKCFHYFYLDEWDYDLDHFIQGLENPSEGKCLDDWTAYNVTCPT